MVIKSLGTAAANDRCQKIDDKKINPFKTTELKDVSYVGKHSNGKENIRNFKTLKDFFKGQEDEFMTDSAVKDHINRHGEGLQS